LPTAKPKTAKTPQVFAKYSSFLDYSEVCF
jgi:hypothetical protein